MLDEILGADQVEKPLADFNVTEVGASLCLFSAHYPVLYAIRLCKRSRTAYSSKSQQKNKKALEIQGLD
jgi:hypothetical protein